MSKKRKARCHNVKWVFGTPVVCDRKDGHRDRHTWHSHGRLTVIW